MTHPLRTLLYELFVAAASVAATGVWAKSSRRSCYYTDQKAAGSYKFTFDESEMKRGVSCVAIGKA